MCRCALTQFCLVELVLYCHPTQSLIEGFYVMRPLSSLVIVVGFSFIIFSYKLLSYVK